MLLFPAYAGVIPGKPTVNKRLITFPRLRGGDPDNAEMKNTVADFSPPTRG